MLYGPYDNHVKEAWKMKDNPNFHLIIFEEMKKEPEKEIRRLCEFLNVNITEEQFKNVSVCNIKHFQIILKPFSDRNCYLYSDLH